MRIGVMLRHLGEPGGINIYTQNVLDQLLRIDRDNAYLLLFQRTDQCGSYSSFPNVTEHVISAPNKLLWDQLAVPRFCRAHNLDLVYNPKLSVPLFARAKTIFTSHGAEQFVLPHLYKWHDRVYFTITNRLYCRRADAIIAQTHTGAEDMVKYMHADRRKIRVIYESYNEACRILDDDELRGAREKHSLPERFILFVGGIEPKKNLTNLLKAYASVRTEIPHELVVVGFKRWKYEKDFQLIQELGLADAVHFTGLVAPEDVPVIYNLAELFVLPSFYEGFGMPVLEAMACGCPVITTKLGCSPEVAGGAALLIDPYSPEQIGEAMTKVLTDRSLREELIEKGQMRAREFSWESTARQTLALFESLMSPAG